MGSLLKLIILHCLKVSSLKGGMVRFVVENIGVSVLPNDPDIKR